MSRNPHYRFWSTLRCRAFLLRLPLPRLCLFLVALLLALVRTTSAACVETLLVSFDEYGNGYAYHWFPDNGTGACTNTTTPLAYQLVTDPTAAITNVAVLQYTLPTPAVISGDVVLISTNQNGAGTNAHLIRFLTSGGVVQALLYAADGSHSYADVNLPPSVTPIQVVAGRSGRTTYIPSSSQPGWIPANISYEFITEPVDAADVFPTNRLSISADADHGLLISWGASSGKSVLLQSSNLMLPNWTAVTNFPLVAAGQNHVFVPTPLTETRFYSLNHTQMLLAPAPPMGFMTWYGPSPFGYTAINESLIRGVADFLQTNGMTALGYKYINIDDHWAAPSPGRSNGVLQVDNANFPGGLAALADYVHSRGCKLGLYIGAGTNTCALREGSWGYYDQDAALVAGFGVDAIKIEQCTTSGAPIPGSLGPETSRLTTEMWLAAVAKTGHPMLLNVSTVDAEPWMAAELTSWRYSGDWGPANPPEATYTNFLHHLDTASARPDLAGPGHWNDPDAIYGAIAGRREFWRSLFGMYCLLASPLFLTSLPGDWSPTNQPMTVVTNADAIAINQDAAGIQGTRVWASGPRGPNGNQEIWVKPLGSPNGTSKAVGLLNTDTNAAHPITVQWRAIGLPRGPATVRDCWARSVIDYFTNSFTTNVAPYDMALLRISSGIEPALTPGTNWLDEAWPLPGSFNGLRTNVSPAEFWPMLRNYSVFGPGLVLSNSTQGAVSYTRGLGLHMLSKHSYFLGGAGASFHAEAGFDFRACCGVSAGRLIIRADGGVLHDSGALNSNSLIDVVDVMIPSGTRVLSIETITEEPGGSINNGAFDLCNAYILATP